MSNSILEYMLKERNGMYCHALEVSSVYELESTIESFMDELQNQFTIDDFKVFFNTMELYYLADESLSDIENDNNETELYNFDIDSAIDYLFGN